MKCRRCGEEMELEEYYTTFMNNDEEIELREQFWCSNCDDGPEATCTRVARYKLVREWIEK